MFTIVGALYASSTGAHFSLANTEIDSLKLVLNSYHGNQPAQHTQHTWHAQHAPHLYHTQHTHTTHTHARTIHTHTHMGKKKKNTTDTNTLHIFYRLTTIYAKVHKFYSPWMIF